MRNAFNALLGLSLCVLAVVGYQTPSEAQTAISALVVSTCGTPVTTYTVGRPGAVTLDNTGTLCTAGGGGSGGLSVTDGATFTANSSKFTPGGGEYNSSPTTCSSGAQCTFAITTNRALTIDAVSGSNLAALVAAPVPVIAGTLPTTQAAVATGATTKAQSDLNGNIYISPQQAGGALLSTSDPCGPQNTKLGAPISLTASGQIITGTSAKKTYICAIDVVPAAAQNIALVEGTGSTCVTNIFGLAGGTTAATGWNFQLGGGIARGSGNGTVYSPSADTNAAAANVCLLIAGAGQVSGQISYVQQ